ncbi:MAG: NADPH:quinone oxidoreductase family protein [Hyphomicrobiaceae bacterium]
MKAVLCKTLGGPETLVIEDIGEPTAGAGEVVVRVKAAALNFFDTLIIEGKYQTKPALPFSPCGEIAGVVEAVGAGVTAWHPGDRVMAYLGYGGAREKAVVAAERLVAIPDGVSDEIASGIAITYGTALHGLRDRGALKPGETVAILGASGGAGLAAVEVAKAMGGRVIAVASRAEKLAVCRSHGADETLSTTATDFKDALHGLSGGQGVDIVYDCVGGDLAEPAFRALAWKGRYLVVGFASGDIPRLPLNLFLLKGAGALGVFFGEAARRDPEGLAANLRYALDAVAAGQLRPHVHSVLAIERIVEGLELIRRREVVGKVVLTLG